jgi:hypothetical protein
VETHARQGRRGKGWIGAVRLRKRRMITAPAAQATCPAYYLENYYDA